MRYESLQPQDAFPSEEQAPHISPTQLELFAIPPRTEWQVKHFFQEGNQLFREHANSRNHSDDLQRKVDLQLELLERQNDEQGELGDQYICYRSASAAWLNIYDELSQRDVSMSGINEFFLRCFAANSELHDTLNSTTDDISGVLRYRANKQEARDLALPIIRKYVGDPPQWFKGSRNEWFNYFARHANFGYMLGNGIAPVSPKDMIQMGVLGSTSNNLVPDWLENIHEEEPTHDKVEKEYEEDTREWDATLIHFNELTKRKQQLKEYIDSRYSRFVLNTEQRRRNFLNLGSNGTLANAVIYLNATQEMPEYTGDLSQLRQLNSAQIKTKLISPEESRVNSIRKIAENSIPPEIMALWLERKFKEGDLVANQEISEELAHKLGLLQDEHKEELWGFKDIDKKFFRLANYELKPLLTLLSEDEQQYIFELLEVSSGEHIEPLIWELAEILPSAIKNSTEPSAKKIKEDLKKFTVSWLTNNWEWAYKQLEDTLEGRRVPHRKAFDVWDGLQEDNIDEWDETEAEILDGWESVEDRLEEARLNAIEEDWTFQYAPNRRTDSELIPINGDTLEEKEESLEDLLYKENQQVSIKKSSMINALVWLSSMPPEHANVLPSMTINGEEWKKIKRGPVRLLCRIDRDNRCINFIAHQKKAMSYRF